MVSLSTSVCVRGVLTRSYTNLSRGYGSGHGAEERAYSKYGSGKKLVLGVYSECDTIAEFAATVDIPFPPIGIEPALAELFRML